MRKKVTHGLKRIKLRQSWHKYNLYNLSRLTSPHTETRTFFQQKWTAKSVTRNYHGDQIREKQWQRQFNPHMASVVPMNHVYLAKTDGSEQAAGRGSGVEKRPDEKTKLVPKTPYTNMVYAPIERRLDTAIFRAMFASSTRQARQFVVHGTVKVNGKKMIYPGYMLNPGDMFQVEPDRVLFATGAPKDKFERREGRVTKRGQASKPEDAEVEAEAEAEAEAVETEPIVANESSETSASQDGTTGASTAAAPPPSSSTTPQATLKSLLTQARTLLSPANKAAIPAKRKQELRDLHRTLRSALSRPDSPDASQKATTLEQDFSALLSNLSISNSSSSAPSPPPSQEESTILRRAIASLRENPIDASKPYATPWRPRPYLSPFAFIPRYLEVNQNICSAVYLRHTVARPGLAEVPSPFGPETLQLAHNWYLRRR